MKLIDDNIDEEWHEEHVHANPYLVTLAANSFFPKIRSISRTYKMVLGFYVGEMTHWVTLVKDQDIVAEDVNKNYKDKRHLNKWFSIWKKEHKIYKAFFEKAKKKELSKLKEKELFDLFDESFKMAFELRRLENVVEAFNFASERWLRNEVLRFCTKKRIKDHNNIYIKLIAAEKESFLNVYERDLINIANKILKNREDKNRLIAEHLDRFCWIKGNWAYGYEYKKSEVQKELSKLKGQDLDKKLIEMRKAIKDNLRIKKDLMKKYRFTEPIRTLVRVSSFFVYFQDLRKVHALMFIYLSTRFLKEFSRRYDISEENLLKFYVPEIRSILKDKKRRDAEIKKRKRLFLAIHHDKKLDFVYGKKAKEYFKKIVEIDKKEIKEIKGIGASPGKLEGKVRIIHKVGEFNKFKKGEILVTGMTRPEFIVLMKKASAIITNDGGISCHAAIVSRELKIPCIIGTRIATKVLKDGDVVEVDAEKGIVKMIK